MAHRSTEAHDARGRHYGGGGRGVGSLYLEGHPYLARGVVGDLLGFFFLLLLPLAFTRRRARHEALVCLGSIAAVRALDPSWPLRRPSWFWWTSVSAGLLLYGVVRSRRLGVPGKLR